VIHLQNIVIILADTRHTGNIGASARVMKNMGIEDLVLVNSSPLLQLEGIRFASGAEDVLERVKAFPTLREAIGDLHYTFALTRRYRRIRKRTLTVREMVEKIGSFSKHDRVGIVFGSEKFGLSNEQVRLCQEMVRIPARKPFSSINLAQAVGIVCYELFNPPGKEPDFKRYFPVAADMRQREVFYRKLEETLTRIGFLDSPNPDRSIMSLRDVFNRARVSDKDLNQLMGMLKQINRLVR
jgi:tRNA (cytidine32/uridine32-2'-O)-methyltransferase